MTPEEKRPLVIDDTSVRELIVGEEDDDDDDDDDRQTTGTMEPHPKPPTKPE